MDTAYFFDGFDDNRYCLDITTSSIFAVDNIMERLIKKESSDLLIEQYGRDVFISNYNEYIHSKQNGFFQENSKQIYIDNCDTININFASIFVTNRCNLSCKYCFNDGGQSTLILSKEIDKSVFKDAIDYIASHSNTEVGLSFFGGEPLINFNLIKDIVSYCETFDKKWEYTITTNGTLLTYDIAIFFYEHNFKVVVSYDGELQDSYRKSISGKKMRSLIKENIYLLSNILPRKNLSLRCTLTHDMIPYVEGIIDEAISLNTRIGFGIVALPENNSMNITSDDATKYFEIYSKKVKEQLSARNVKNLTSIMSGGLRNLLLGRKKIFSCKLGMNTISINLNGDIYACHRFVGEENYKIGTIQDDIVNNKRDLYILRTVDNRNICSNCWARYLCGGGCAHESVMYEEDINTPYQLQCSLNKKLIELELKVYAEIMKDSNKDLLDELRTYIF